MKTIQKIFFVLLASTLLLTSCSPEDFNLFPTNQVEEEFSFSTMDDVARWSNGLHNALRARSYGIYMFASDIQSDMLAASRSYGNTYGGVHRWDFNSDDYTISDVWGGYYSGIKNVNYLLGHINDFPTVTAAHETSVQQLKGQAHFMRAYYYYMLAMRYCKDYEPVDATTELGLPLVKVYDITAKPSRSSLAETFQFINDELDSARTLIPASVVKYAKLNKVGHDVIDALQARVHFVMHNYAEAATLSAALMAKYPLASSEAELATIWDNDANTSEIILRMSAAKSTETAPTNSIYQNNPTYHSGIGAPRSYYTAPQYWPTTKAITMFDISTDWRFFTYFKDVYVNNGGYLYYRFPVGKYIGNEELYTNPLLTNLQHKPIIFRVAEMYLINAEANYMLGQEGPALTALNGLRTKRGLATVSSAGDVLFQDIKDERTREFMFEGFRLDDLKRWKEGFTRGGANALGVNASGNLAWYAGYVYTGANYDGLTVVAGADKFVWAIPRNDESINPNITQNPGWGTAN